jgi:hypothetical protein
MEEHKEDAQQALDELFNEHLLPFELTAHKVESLGGEEYIVRFHDRRLPSVDVSCRPGQYFKDLVRIAVLERVKRLSGPVNGSKSR